MIKLALIGKDISHSKSHEVYETLLGEAIDYSLLDYLSESDIPKLSDLFKNYRGLSVTSPYKAFFLDQVKVEKEVAKLGAINCIKSIKGKGFFATNTDYLAIVDLVSDFLEKYKYTSVTILGSGKMSNVTQAILKKKKIDHMVLSRKEHGPLETINIQGYLLDKKRPLIINTCSRDFIFQGEIPESAIFWDYNYNFLAHEKLFTSKSINYIDGYSLLLRQAEYALEFWNIT